MESASSLIAIAGAALFLPLLAGRLAVPAIVIEILFGVLIGDAVLGIISSNEFIDQLALLGFFLLMFLSGFEIDLGAVERHGTRRITSAAMVFTLTVITAFVATRVLGYSLFIVFVLATTSVGLVVPTLRDTRTTASALGQSLLLAAILADFLTLVGVTIYAVYVESGFGLGMVGIPGFFVIALATTMFLGRTAWWYPERFERFFVADDPDELGIRAAFALMLVFVGLSELLGIEPVLGAFLSGAVFAYVFREPGPLERKLSGFSYGFLIPIFFINVGMRLDAAVLVDPGVVFGKLLPLLVALFTIKVIAASVLVLRGLSAREALAAGMMLTAGLSLTIAVADLGVRIGAIDHELESVIVALAVIPALVAPVAYRALAPKPPPIDGEASPGDAARRGGAGTAPVTPQR